MFVQPPKPSAFICATIRTARMSRSGIALRQHAEMGDLRTRE